MYFFSPTRLVVEIGFVLGAPEAPVSVYAVHSRSAVTNLDVSVVISFFLYCDRLAYLWKTLFILCLWSPLHDNSHVLRSTGWAQQNATSNQRGEQRESERSQGEDPNVVPHEQDPVWPGLLSGVHSHHCSGVHVRCCLQLLYEPRVPRYLRQQTEFITNNLIWTPLDWSVFF